MGKELDFPFIWEVGGKLTVIILGGSLFDKKALEEGTSLSVGTYMRIHSNWS